MNKIKFLFKTLMIVNLTAINALNFIKRLWILLFLTPKINFKRLSINKIADKNMVIILESIRHNNIQWFIDKQHNFLN